MTSMSTKTMIAHRGNLDGPYPEKENHPDYIIEAANQGFNVEVDVWLIGHKWLLGHDEPQYEVNFDILSNPKFWLHCKNIISLAALTEAMHCWEYYDCFYHNTDDVTLTCRSWLWTYPGKELTESSIAVMPERVPDWDLSKAYGICTDFPIKYKALFHV